MAGTHISRSVENWMSGSCNLAQQRWSNSATTWCPPEDCCLMMRTTKQALLVTPVSTTVLWLNPVKEPQPVQYAMKQQDYRLVFSRVLIILTCKYLHHR